MQPVQPFSDVDDLLTAPNRNAAALAALLFAWCLAAAVSSAPAAAQAPVVEKSSPPATGTTPASAPSAATQPAATSAASTGALKSFVTVGDKPTIMFDAPSNRANKIFILNRLVPLEVLVKLGSMTKVRDAEGAIGWVENSGLGDRRHVQVSANSAEIRAMPSSTAPLVFDAQKAVLLEVAGNATSDGWLPVKHRDGQSGFVRLTQIWGD